jgi:hypothetical protein
VTVLSLVLYGRAVLILSASAGSAFGALVRALSALIAIPLLGNGRQHQVGWGSFSSLRVCISPAGAAEISPPIHVKSTTPLAPICLYVGLRLIIFRAWGKGFAFHRRGNC